MTAQKGYEKNLEQEISIIIYHQFIDDGRFLRVHPHSAHLLSGKRHYRLKDWHCLNVHVHRHSIVPPLRRIHPGQF